MESRVNSPGGHNPSPNKTKPERFYHIEYTFCLNFYVDKSKGKLLMSRRRHPSTRKLNTPISYGDDMIIRQSRKLQKLSLKTLRNMLKCKGYSLTSLKS